MANLGALPPPSSLVSLPVSTIPSLCDSVVCSNPLTTTTSGPIPLQPRMSTGLLGSAGASPVSQTPGMILSPAADPIPHTLVQRIMSGQFVEMRDMLADNIALINQQSLLHGTVTLPQSAVSRTALRDVPSLVSWLYCFIAYTAVRTADPVTRDMLAYSRLIVREVLRSGGSGWLEYDRVFRRQLSINPNLAWNTLEPGLQATTILGQKAAGGTFCTICRECDHTSHQCALSPLQQLTQPASTTPVIPTAVPPATSRPPRRPETLLHICVNWNKGVCKRTLCTYRHICATCQLSHRARDCPDTPAESMYKASSSQSALNAPRSLPRWN